MKKPSTVVVALGNPLMSDEGIGPCVLARLERHGVPRDVELVDLGTNGLAVLHAVDGREKAVLIDCARMGLPPGALCRFHPVEARTKKMEMRMTSHGGDLIQVLTLAERLGINAGETVLIGIEPGSMAPGVGLSEALVDRVDEYADAVRMELEAVHA